jgi:hypothetical protein
VIRSEELDPVERYPRVAAQRLAPCLGFDGEDTARADEHMVEIEAIGQHVVEGLIPLLAKPVQELADRSLTVDAQAQGAQPRAKANDPPSREGSNGRRTDRHQPRTARAFAAVCP